jgi:hypothetical protein
VKVEGKEQLRNGVPRGPILYPEIRCSWTKRVLSVATIDWDPKIIKTSALEIEASTYVILYV